MPAEPRRLSKLAERLVADLRGIAPEDPARSVKRPTQSLAAVVEELLNKHHIGRDSAEQTIRDHWAEVVGSANA